MQDKTLQSTSPIGAAEYFGTLTAIHLILIGIGILAAIAIIVWGSKRWRENKVAMRQLDAEGRLERVEEEAPVEPVPVAESQPAEPAPVVAPVSEAIPQPVPVAPPPPPPAPPPPPQATDPEPSAQPEPPASPAASEGEDLTRLKGLGPKVAARLGELGVTRIAQLAALDEGQAADLDARLGNFKGRMGRDRWIEQARLLAAGDIAGYEAQFGKLG